MLIVLFTLTPSFNPDNGGVQRTTSKLSKKFSEYGYEVHIFSSANEGHVNFNYARIHPAREDGGELNNANSLQLEELIQDIKPDVVINQMPYILAFQEAFLRAKKRNDFYLVGCLRNSLYSVKSNLSQTMKEVLPGFAFTLVNNKLGRYLYLQLHRQLNRQKLRRILEVHDQFMLLTPVNRDELEFFVGKYFAEKVSWIPNSIPYVTSVNRPREKVILHVGRLNDTQKRSDLLVPFWKSIYQRIPDWKFVIIGDGEYMRRLKKEIQAEGLERVELLGFQNPDIHYQNSAIFMMPSSFEGFPNTFIEAQSYGLPCLAFNSYPAISWIGNDQEDCFLIDDFNTAKMGEAALSLCCNHELWERMSLNAIKNAEKFTIETVGQYWQKFFREKAGLNE